MGTYAGRVRFTWDFSDPDVVALRAEARNPTVLPRVLARPLGVDRVDRTVRVRTERPVATNGTERAVATNGAERRGAAEGAQGRGVAGDGAPAGGS